MKYKNNVLELIGNTPIVKLSKIGKGCKVNLFVKLEFMNPSGSIKDRMVSYLFDHEEAKGNLHKGQNIVENSSGNTGSSIAMISAIKGYNCTITMPDKMSSEKINKIRAYGGEVHVTPTNVTHDSEESYYSKAKALAKELRAWYPDQYNNSVNAEAHYHSTGAEIFEQTGNEIDYLIAGIGTGGTISGIGKYLKEKCDDIKIIAVDPVGSVFYDFFKSQSHSTPHSYKVEGIGEDYLVEAIDYSVIDDMYQVNDQESFSYARRMAREEGILSGGSGGAALAAAFKLIEDKKLTEGNILIIIPDGGYQYLSKFYDDNWFGANGFTDL